MRKQFGIKVTETMEEEVEEMSHICMYYEQEGKKAGLTEGMLIGEKRGMLIGERRGKKSGLAKGIKQGKREGETKQINATISYVKNLMHYLNFLNLIYSYIVKHRRTLHQNHRCTIYYRLLYSINLMFFQQIYHYFLIHTQLRYQ